MDDTVDWDAYIETSCALLGIAVSDEAKPIVRANLELAARMAALVNAFPLDEREEPAPVFTA